MAFISEESRSPLRKGTENVFTVVCWILYLYLILPLFTMILWYLGVRTFYDRFIGERGYSDLLFLIREGGVIVLCVMIVLLGWSQYNYIWFKRRGERRGTRPIQDSDRQFSELLGCMPEDMPEVRKARRLEIQAVEAGYRILSKE